MACFLVEQYLSRTDPDAFARDSERARLAAEELSREGTRVSYLQAIFVPEDETCFHLYEAVSRDRVREAARRADLPLGGVFEVISRRHGAPSQPGYGG